MHNAGDVRETYHRLASGGLETYHAQRYSLDSYAAINKLVDEFTVMTSATEERYDEVLPNGVRAIGAGLASGADSDTLIRLISRHAPTHLAIHPIDSAVIRWAARQQIPAITTLANTLAREKCGFPRNIVREAKTRRTARALNRDNFRWVGSYGINSSRELARLGVNPEKIIPWDYLIDTDPGPFTAKQSPSDRDHFTLCYVGTVSEGKGVAEMIEAVAILNSMSINVTLKLVGPDTANFARVHCTRHDVEDRVELLGLMPSDSIEPLMHECDLVMVPSRHDYPEGFPLVIHHALRACTPTIASDHPMFASHLKHRENAMIFPQKDAKKMAECIAETLTTPELYESISAASHATWKRLRLPVKWADLTTRWIRNDRDDQDWLSERSLANLDNGKG
ncbi:group 1 glycosyl transferase [Rhodopirellula maiorica SM1]|uniref:Group 1 glycosyl transferase n=1 Tax=Rhodopirellula maiorica SM1 TaxID=1265738 RepID=M5S6P2_9BACT|nr:group 1 glycosyl transferase [Rhodopirellula maiorica SM1]